MSSGARPEDAHAQRQALAGCAHILCPGGTHPRRAGAPWGDANPGAGAGLRLNDDVESARGKARAYAALYLGLRNYTNNLLNHGFDEHDIANGGSDRLIDAIVPHGSAEKVAAAARQHLSAGADHVCLQIAGVEGVARSEWTALASALGSGSLHRA